MTDCRRLCSTIFVYLISMILVAICGGIIYGLTIGKNNFTESHKGKSDKAATNVLSIVISLVITIINAVLLTLIRKLSLAEKNETKTLHNLSVSLKLTVVRFVNTAIVPIIVNAKVSTWFVEGGLVSNIFYIFLSLAFLNTLL